MAGIDSNSVLVCRMDGTTTSFVDSSPSHKAVTANGNATQATRKFNGTAGWFDGVDSRVTIPDSSDWAFSGDFTIEMFAMFGSVSGNRTLWCHGTDSNNYSSFTYDPGAGGFRFIIGAGTIQVDVTGTYSPAVNIWYHLAVRRSGNIWTVWVDGTQVGTTTVAYSYVNYTQPMSIGQLYIDGDYNQEFLGWMKELRISDTARTITVPTSAYTSDSNTKLLLHFDNALATGPLAPAIKFDGTGDYLTLADSADWDFGTGEWTMEGWVRWNSVGSTTLIDTGSAAGVRMAVYDTGGTPGFHVYVVNTEYSSSGFVPVANRWYHFAAVRSSDTLLAFIDGVQVLSTSIAGKDVTGLSAGLFVGATTAAATLLNGWVREIRVSNTARYTAAFTPSQTGFTVDANTKLYIKGNESNGVTTFVDSETVPKTVTTVGDTKINYIEDYRATIFKDDGNTGHKPYAPVASLAKVDFLAPFGSGVCALDGTGDYLSVADSADWDFGTGEFALETYVRFSSVAAATLFDRNDAGEFQFFWDTTLKFFIEGGSVIATAFTPIAHNWYHLAVTRSGSSVRAFANGTLLDTQTSSGDIQGTDAVYIGIEKNGTLVLNGYLDNARISNVARYTATFNPPGQFNTGGLNQAVIL